VLATNIIITRHYCYWNSATILTVGLRVGLSVGVTCVAGGVKVAQTH